MSKHEEEHVVEIHMDQSLHVSLDACLLRQAALEVLNHQQAGSRWEMAVMVTGDEALRELNCRHRGVDAPTDVLAFPNDSREPFIDAPDVPRYLGDVVVSLPRAEAQAAEAGHDVQDELQLLVVHGVLHLLGYDDQSSDARAKMWAVQAQILRLLGLDIDPPL